MKRSQIRVTKETHRKLKIEAAKRGLTLEEVIKSFIISFENKKL